MVKIKDFIIGSKILGARDPCSTQLSPIATSFLNCLKLIFNANLYYEYCPIPFPVLPHPQPSK